VLHPTYVRKRLPPTTSVHDWEFENDSRGGIPACEMDYNGTFVFAIQNPEAGLQYLLESELYFWAPRTCGERHVLEADVGELNMTLFPDIVEEIEIEMSKAEFENRTLAVVFEMTKLPQL